MPRFRLCRRFRTSLASTLVAMLCLAVCRTSAVAETPAVNAYDEAIAARDRAAATAYEKMLAERTIKGSELNIKQIESMLEQQRKAAESGAKQDVEKYERSLARKKQLQEEAAAAEKSLPERAQAVADAKQRAEKLREAAGEFDRARAAKQDPHAVAQRIDAIIEARLAKDKIAAAPQVDDLAYLRRVTLDVCGTIPTYEQVTAFLDDGSTGKRRDAVDRLLADPAYGRNFAQRFCTVTTELGTSTVKSGRDSFNEWLTDNLNLNRGWDHIVDELISADGRGYEHPAALFTVAYRMNEQPDPALLLGAVGDHFLGLQIQCAQCHDHPHHEWRHDEFWQMAALIGRVRMKGNLQIARELEYLLTDDDVPPKELLRVMGIVYPDQLTNGQIEIPDPVNAGKNLQTVSAKFLDGSMPTLPEKGNNRKALGAWVTSKQNPYFARATVNRIWAHFFGRGIVEPLLNLHPDNEPSHPELLALLAEEFIATDFDLKHLIRSITATKAYARSSRASDAPQAFEVDKDNRLLARMSIKPLDSYVMIDALSTVLHRPPPVGSRRRDDAALFDTRLPGGDPTKYTHGIPQVLKLMNAREHGDQNQTIQTATNRRPPEEAIEHLFLAVLARKPTSAERDEMLAYYEQLGNPRAAYNDIYWVLLNSAEFLVNH